MATVIGDGGRSWCICGGLSHGFMIGCDFCDQWYHGDCVGVSVENAPIPLERGGSASVGRRGGLSEHDQGKYRCPKCSTLSKPYRFERAMASSRAIKADREASEAGRMAGSWLPVELPTAREHNGAADGSADTLAGTEAAGIGAGAEDEDIGTGIMRYVADPWLEDRSNGDVALRGLAQFGCYQPGGGSTLAEPSSDDESAPRDEGEEAPVSVVPLAPGSSAEQGARRPWVGRLPLVVSFAHLRPQRNAYDAATVQRIVAQAPDGWVSRIGSECLPPPSPLEAAAAPRSAARGSAT